MTKSTVSTAAVSSVSAEDTINNSIFTLGAIWALAMGYLPVLGIGLMTIIGK